MKILVVGKDGFVEAEYDHPASLPDAVLAVNVQTGKVSTSAKVVEEMPEGGGQPTRRVKSYGGSTSLKDIG